MENVGSKLEQLFLKAGQTHYYQYTITILFSLEFCCTHFLNYCIPYLERFPEIEIPDIIKNSNEKEFSFYDICSNSTNYTMYFEGKITSIVEEFGIYCNKKKIYFIGLCYYVGKIVGSWVSYLFIDGIGRRSALFIFMPISILLMGAFKFMKASYSSNWIYGIYVDLFCSGVSNYIIVVDIIIYICENVEQSKIPYFIMFVVTGSSIAGLICSLTFYNDNSLDWRNILLIFGGIHLLLYILLIFFLIGSPMFALNEENFEDFLLYLRKIASRNGKSLNQEDFLFLSTYMSKESRKRVFKNQEEKILNFSTLSNSDSNTKENQSQKTPSLKSTQNTNINDNNNNTIFNINNINNDNNSDNNKIIINNMGKNNLDEKEPEQEATYVSVNNMIYSHNQLSLNANPVNNNTENIPQNNTKNNIVTHKNNKRRDSIFQRGDSQMRDVYLLSRGEDADVPVRSLFGESKMKDFTPLDLLRFSSQIKNFLTLSFIWIVADIIRTGIDLQKKYMLDYIGKLEYPIINFVLDICLPAFLLIIYYYQNYLIQKILITANLIQFIFFVFVGFFIQKTNSKTTIVILILGKVFCHIVYLIMCVITSEIYPIMIRTKGIGFNIGFSGIGAIVSIFLVENLKLDSLILYFLLFNFYSLIICHGLPNKIGTLLLDNPKGSKKEEGESDDDEEDVKLGDICIENAVLANPEINEKAGITKTKI